MTNSNQGSVGMVFVAVSESGVVDPLEGALTLPRVSLARYL